MVIIFINILNIFDIMNEFLDWSQGMRREGKCSDVDTVEVIRELN